jgi:hypothetical protein
MFNREYQTRATRQGIRSILAQDFYRPAKLPDPRARRGPKPKGPEQLTLNFDSPRRYFSDVECPLKDVFPDAYLPNE